MVSTLVLLAAVASAPMAPPRSAEAEGPEASPSAEAERAAAAKRARERSDREYHLAVAAVGAGVATLYGGNVAMSFAYRERPWASMIASTTGMFSYGVGGLLGVYAGYLSGRKDVSSLYLAAAVAPLAHGLALWGTNELLRGGSERPLLGVAGAIGGAYLGQGLLAAMYPAPNGRAVYPRELENWVIPMLVAAMSLAASGLYLVAAGPPRNPVFR